MANGHGGARANAGRPKKDLSTAVMDGTRPSRLKATKFENVPTLVDEQTPTAPECMSYLKEEQRAGVALNAEKFFKDIWEWLVARGCQNLFEVSYLQRYAMQQARYVQLEQLISKLGFLSKTENGGAKDNPLEAMAINRLKLVNTMQQTIENTVRANCAEPFSGMPNTADPMEILLRGG
jgi:hypothetical protein